MMSHHAHAQASPLSLHFPLTPTLSPAGTNPNAVNLNGGGSLNVPSSPFFASSIFPPLNSPFLSPLIASTAYSSANPAMLTLTPLIGAAPTDFFAMNSGHSFAFNSLPIVPNLILSAREHSASPAKSLSALDRSLTGGTTSSGSDGEDGDEFNISMKPMRFHDDHHSDDAEHHHDESPASSVVSPSGRVPKRKSPTRARATDRPRTKKRKSRSSRSPPPPASPASSMSSDGSVSSRSTSPVHDPSTPTINIRLGVGSSCHQCKTRKLLPELFVCGNFDKKKVKLSGKKLCRKKYCARCLIKFYNQQPPETPVGATGCTSLGQDCPSCTGQCVCAACRKRYARDANRELSDLMSEAHSSILGTTEPECESHHDSEHEHDIDHHDEDHSRVSASSEAEDDEELGSGISGTSSTSSSGCSDGSSPSHPQSETATPTMALMSTLESDSSPPVVVA